ncbi:hypothetical protein JCM8547_004348 [Rhodosporidiobolus lusitaniae]
MDQQELIDRLHKAVEEEDVLYTYIRLKELETMGALAEVPRQKHSWKGHSVLAEAVKHRERTPWRILILETLLLQVKDPVQTRAFDVASEIGNEWVVEVMRGWNAKGGYEAQRARHLLSLDVDGACSWIDDEKNLPPRPRASSMTGYGTLPPSPSQPAGQEQDVVEYDPALPSSHSFSPKQGTRATLARRATSRSPLRQARLPPSAVYHIHRRRHRPSQQLRLSSVPPHLDYIVLFRLLPKFSGQKALNPAGSGVFLLSFESQSSARCAL